jgi:hypothetical protein
VVVREVVPALAGRAYARIRDWGLEIGYWENFSHAKVAKVAKGAD